MRVGLGPANSGPKVCHFYNRLEFVCVCVCVGGRGVRRRGKEEGREGDGEIP